jgi:FkbM family methyltransferase
VPDIVDVVLPAHLGGLRFSLSGEGGRDQVARDLFLHGWEGFEAPAPDVFGAWAAGSRGVVLDVGANTGLYALLAARVAPAVEVRAFEPYGAARAVLERNLALNPDLAGRVEVVPWAVSDRQGEAPLYVPSDAHGLVETSCSLDPTFKDDVVGAVTVPVTTLDDYTAGGGTSGPVVLIKVDVEGHESQALAGAEAVLARDQPVVLVEVLPRADGAALTALVHRQGYRSFRLRPDGAVEEDHVAFDPAAWNHLLVPPAQADQWDRIQRTLFG